MSNPISLSRDEDCSSKIHGEEYLPGIGCQGWSTKIPSTSSGTIFSDSAETDPAGRMLNEVRQTRIPALSARIKSKSKEIERLLREMLETNQRAHEIDSHATEDEVNALKARLESIASERAKLDGQDQFVRTSSVQNIEQGR